MIKIFQIIILVIASILLISSSCDKGSEGCIDDAVGENPDINGNCRNGFLPSNESQQCNMNQGYYVCNYDPTAIINDDSCWSKNNNCSCDDPPHSTVDCLGVCDNDIINDPPTDNVGNCDQSVIGGCMDSLICNYDELVTHNDGSCALDLEGFGGLSDGTDCDGNCGGQAVEDACGFCVGGESTVAGKFWTISIFATAVFSDSTRISDLAHIGASIYAKDGYNNENMMETECNGCYIDFAENCGYSDSLCFYFPHDEWVGEIDTIFTNGYDFDRDIRKNDLHVLFTNGIDWEAQISSVISESVFIDSLLLDFTLIQGLESCIITVNLDFGGEYEVQNNHLEIEVGTDEDINLTFNISNICFSEFE